MAGIVAYGVFIGAGLCILPSTRKLGVYILGGSVGLFFITLGVLFVGQILGAMLPFIVVIAIIFMVCNSARNKGKPKKKDIEKMSNVEKIDYLRKHELALRNISLKKWQEEILKSDSPYMELMDLANIDKDVLGVYKGSELLLQELDNLKGNFEDINNRCKEAFQYEEYLNSIKAEQFNSEEVSSEVLKVLNEKLALQQEIFPLKGNFNKLINDTKKIILNDYVADGLKDVKLFIFGQYRLRLMYETINDMYDDSLQSLLKTKFLFSLVLNEKQEITKSWDFINSIFEKFETLNEVSRQSDIEKMKHTLYMAAANSKASADIELARDVFMENLAKKFKDNSEEYFKFEELENTIIGGGAYYKKQFEEWVSLDDGRSIYSFIIQYKKYVLQVADGFIIEIEEESSC